MATGDIGEYKAYIEKINVRLDTALHTVFKGYEYRLRAVDVARISQNAVNLIERKLQTLDYLQRDMSNSVSRLLNRGERDFDNLLAKLDSLSPLKTLKRGYAVVSREDGVVLSRADAVSPGDRIDIRLEDGKLNCEVKGNERF